MLACCCSACALCAVCRRWRSDAPAHAPCTDEELLHCHSRSANYNLTQISEAIVNISLDWHSSGLPRPKTQKRRYTPRAHVRPFAPLDRRLTGVAALEPVLRRAYCYSSVNAALMPRLHRRADQPNICRGRSLTYTTRALWVAGWPAGLREAVSLELRAAS